MSYPDNFSDGELEAAVAAAAYAINSLEEKALRKNRGSVKFSEDSSLPKPKSKNEDTRIKLTSFSGSFKRWFSDQEAKEQDRPTVSGDGFTRKSETAEQMNLEGRSANQSILEKETDNTPSIKPTPMFTDNSLNDTGIKRVDSGKEIRPGPQKAPTIKYPTSSFSSRTQDAYSADSSLGSRTQDAYSAGQSEADAEAKAYAWEKAQMIKIKKRYDKMMSMIMDWENEKKTKAKSRLGRKENEPEDRRNRALQKYEDEISEIDKVAGEARALAEERKRNDETKARVKAAKIRSTGKIPHACCCCC